MQLFKSLFCVNGFDNRSRFLMISIATYIIFFIIHAIFSNHQIFTITLLFVLVTINIFTALKRLNDALLNRKWCLGAGLSFLITGLIIIFTGHNSVNWLLLLPFSVSAILLTYPSKSDRSYILGYSGPVDLSEFDKIKTTQRRQSIRIEPTLAANQPIQSANSEVYTTDRAFEVESNEAYRHASDTNSRARTSTNERDIGETIRLKLFSGKNAKLTLVILATVILSAILISFVISLLNNEEQQSAPVIQPVVKAVRTSQVTFPDNFSLWLSQHKGLIVNWQADTTSKEQLWDLSTAEGENSCQEIAFNNGNTIRTTEVLVENKENYFASFSPLDTEKLLQEIAFRGNFTLCGYKFSLKGSQAILGKHADYASMISY